MKNLILFLVISLTFISCATKAKKTIIAHRGAPGYLPEHSLTGVSMAHSWGVDFIEPDLVLSKDNEVMVLHDIHIDTTTNVQEVFPKRKRRDGRFYAVDFTLEELKRLTLNERINLKTGKRVFSGRYPLKKTSFEIPTFIEFIELVQGLNKSTGRNVGIYPEIKSPEFHKQEKKDITKHVFNILNNKGYNKKDANIYVQCFYPFTLIRLRGEFGAKFPMIQLIAENSWKESSVDYDNLRTLEGLGDMSPYIQGIGPYINHLYTIENGKIKKTKLVEWAHGLGLKVHPYTHRSDSLPKGFESEKQLLDFLFNDLNVDGVFSDFGDLVQILHLLQFHLCSHYHHLFHVFLHHLQQQCEL